MVSWRHSHLGLLPRPGNSAHCAKGQKFLRSHRTEILVSRLRLKFLFLDPLCGSTGRNCECGQLRRHKGVRMLCYTILEFSPWNKKKRSAERDHTDVYSFLWKSCYSQRILFVCVSQSAIYTHFRSTLQMWVSLDLPEPQGSSK